MRACRNTTFFKYDPIEEEEADALDLMDEQDRKRDKKLGINLRAAKRLAVNRSGLRKLLRKPELGAEVGTPRPGMHRSRIPSTPSMLLISKLVTLAALPLLTSLGFSVRNGWSSCTPFLATVDLAVCPAQHEVPLRYRVVN